MRRTYKSKKDAPGAIDRRDVLLDDPKASVFDAFYIQNLKQSKREMSVGSTFQFAASNKVRKRKYVKRVKEQEPSIRESTSRSVFLTPDKSFRVNKAPDLFDQLLNSSSVNIDSATQEKQFTIIPQSHRRKYKKKQQKYKKVNYSSNDSSDSNKENTGSEDITKNSSDIKSHELIIEKKKSMKPIDHSINNIFNNLSLFNQNENSPLVQSSLNGNILNKKSENSPLCSTPFNEKYRGKSIYRFSPISINLEDSPKCLNSVEITDSKDTIKKEADNDTYSRLRKSIILHISNKHISSHKFSAKNETIKRVKNDMISNTIEQDSVIQSSLNNINVSENNVGNKHDQSDILSKGSQLEKELSSSLTTSDISQDHVTKLTNVESENDFCSNSKEYSLDDLPSKPFLGFTRIETEHSVSRINDKSSDNSTENYIENADTESLYDTCDSDKEIELLNIKQPIVVIDRLNISTINKYLKDDISQSSSDDNLDEPGLNYNNGYEITEEREKSILHNPSNDLSEILGTDLLDIAGLNNEGGPTESNSSDSYKESTCVSFVTTRRRNDIAKDSFIIAVDNSFDNFNDSLNNTYGSDSTIIKESDTHQVSKSSDVSVSESDPNGTMLGLCHNVTILDKIDAERKIINMVERTSPKFIGDLKDISINIANEHLATTNNKFKSQKSIINHISSVKETERDSANITDRNLNFTTHSTSDNVTEAKETKHPIMLKPGKKWERSLSIYRRMTTMTDHFDSSILDDEHLENKGRKYRQSVISTMEMQDFAGPDHNVSINSRRSTFISKPIRSTIRILKEISTSNVSICSTSDEIQGFLTEDCDDTVIELSKLSIADYEPEVTVLEKFHDTSNRRVAARDYVLRRCNQSDAILFDECYPDTALKNCRKIGEGVYGEVFLWRAGDGRARVLKIIPIAGSIKVNGEDQKDYDEIISEIVIAMELSALRTPVSEIEKHLDEGKSIETLDLHSVENATDIFNEVLAVRCVYGTYPARLLDLWELYDESRGSENDSPAALPPSQHFLVLELANAGQDLEGFHFSNAEQAYSVFWQVAFGLAVAEEALQFEHRDLHWGNVLISPTDEKWATFVVGGRLRRVARRGVAATVIDYSLSRVSLALGGRGGRAALYNDLAADEALFDAAGDYQFDVYRLMRDKLANDWKSFEPYTNVLWLHYTADKMITALRYARATTKVHKHYIAKLKELKERLLSYDSALQLVLAEEL